MSSLETFAVFVHYCVKILWTTVICTKTLQLTVKNHKSVHLLYCLMMYAKTVISAQCSNCLHKILVISWSTAGPIITARSRSGMKNASFSSSSFCTAVIIFAFSSSLLLKLVLLTLFFRRTHGMSIAFSSGDLGGQYKVVHCCILMNYFTDLGLWSCW